MTGAHRRTGMALLVALAVLGDARAADAETCAITSTVDVLFGTYDVFDSAPVDSVGSIVYHCTGVVESDTVRIDLGTGGGSYALREMARGVASLGYNLFLDAARSIVFGDGTGGTASYGPITPPEATDVTVPVYGRVPARQSVAAGTYTDTITVTITF